MKRILLILTAGLMAGSLLLAGCTTGVSQEEYDAVVEELNDLKATCPPRDFASMADLNDWLLQNDVSEKPQTTYAEDWYGRALEVQEDAARDGYLVSADYDYNPDEESYFVWCITVINGRVFFWDPETDQVYEDETLGTVK